MNLRSSGVSWDHRVRRRLDGFLLERDEIDLWSRGSIGTAREEEEQEWQGEQDDSAHDIPPY